MGKYESYAFENLKHAFEDRWSTGDERLFSYGRDAGIGSVDGLINGHTAVEVAAGSLKQIRGSLLDLALHPAPIKLLVLVDTPQHPTHRAADQARAILDSLNCLAVVVRFIGTPSNPRKSSDVALLRRAVEAAHRQTGLQALSS